MPLWRKRYQNGWYCITHNVHYITIMPTAKNPLHGRRHFVACRHRVYGNVILIDNYKQDLCKTNFWMEYSNLYISELLNGTWLFVRTHSFNIQLRGCKCLRITNSAEEHANRSLRYPNPDNYSRLNRTEGKWQTNNPTSQCFCTFLWYLVSEESLSGNPPLQCHRDSTTTLSRAEVNFRMYNWGKC